MGNSPRQVLEGDREAWRGVSRVQRPPAATVAGPVGSAAAAAGNLGVLNSASVGLANCMAMGDCDKAEQPQ